MMILCVSCSYTRILNTLQFIVFPTYTNVCINLVSFDVNTDMSQGNALIKFNVNDTGFYRVNYPPDVWRRIADALESQGPAAVCIVYH
jgi:hypothetical protein